MSLKKVDKEQSYMVESMKGLFMIVKGQYSKTEPAVKCSDGEEHFIGGYDPSNEDTSEWYQLMDRVNYDTISCGGSLEQITNRITRTIVRYNNDRMKYLAEHGATQTYEDEGGNKCRRCVVSPKTRMLMEKVEEFYGDYFDDIIEAAENEAYKELANKPKKTLKKSKPNNSTHAPKKSLKRTTTKATAPVVEEEEELPFTSEYETKVIGGKRKTISTRPKKSGGLKNTPVKKKDTKVTTGFSGFRKL